jgi:hypothetical protein
MGQHEMIATLERHLTAGDDVEGAMGVYTDDVVHDAVGFPGSPALARARHGSSIVSSSPTSTVKTATRSTGSSRATP